MGIIKTRMFLLILIFGFLSDGFAQQEPNKITIERLPIFQKYLKMAAQTEQKERAAQGAEIARPRTAIVRMADFHLKDGKLLFGKLVDEDRNKITVEQLEGSKIIVSTYSKRDIDPRTLQIKTIPEYKYYIDLAEYFSGRTWDFTDDPDDFIQAIRCYEKAKLLSVGAETQGSDRIGQIDEKIKQLQADREVWTKETQSRAELKKLEFQAEFEKRFKELEDKVNASTQKVNESVERLDKAVTAIQENQKKLEQSITVMEQETSRRLNIIADQIDANRRLTEPFYWAPRYRYPYGY